MKRIIYTYEHALSSTSRVIRQKKGYYIGKIKHTYKHWKPGAVQMIRVKLDGNKKSSVVPFDKIQTDPNPTL